MSSDKNRVKHDLVGSLLNSSNCLRFISFSVIKM
jgi:hypothetical protein